MLKSPRSSSILIVVAALTAIVFSSTIFAESLIPSGFDPPEYQTRQHDISSDISRRSVQAITVNVTAPAVNRLVGSNFSVPVTVSDMTGAGIISFQFDLLYDQTIITPQLSPIDTAGTLSSGFLPTVNPSAPGLLKVVFFGTVPPSGSGVLFNFKFTAVGTAGQTSPLTWQNFMFNEGDPANIAANGSVTLVVPSAAGVSIDGRVTDTSGRPIRNAIVTLNGDHGFQRAGRTNAFGYFALIDIPTGAVYVLSTDSKQFTVQPRIINVNDNITGIELVAEPIL
ncbi:MAG TPA: cohesin domain-containing protein [Pyrinomonadaceae bacterium]|nr:cohesin domain-containing protein [Pyrinomonadaceae bacterium]